MLRTFWPCPLLLLSLLASGCAMCCSPDDYTYSAFGGRWQREDMLEGRVGSAFAASGSVVADDSWFLPEESVPVETAWPEMVPTESKSPEAAPTEARPVERPQSENGSLGRQGERSVLR